MQLLQGSATCWTKEMRAPQGRVGESDHEKRQDIDEVADFDDIY
jgi:hypothetical protein